MAVKLSPPDNFLMCREARQITHYRLMHIEAELKEKLGVKTDAELERAMLEKRSIFPALIAQYHQHAKDFADADEMFDAACMLQRQKIGEKA